MLEYYKAIWKAKSEALKDKIIESLESLPIGSYSQATYYEYWRKLIRDETGLNCDPVDYLRAFSYKTFSEYFEAVDGKKKK